MRLVKSEILEEMKRGNIQIMPFNKNHLGPNSLDLTLGNEILIPWGSKIIDPTKETPEYDIEHLPYPLAPKGFVLCATKEKVTLRSCISALICGRSSISRLGLGVEQAPFVDTGFSGNLTLEVFNFSNYYIKLVPGIRIAQLWFEKHSPVEEDYQKNNKTKYTKEVSDGPVGFIIDKEFRNVSAINV